ncbi:hypothetical protein PR048_022174 [Dryococelus australis]|uniref:Uncharacterized protein n=1 Tax=Dryococelus australis TaxID=614101 RepID=A0ABQ9H0C1_9NEOP|nr:hypothetical protein PR048_022174 [Dryococelus australis]
MVPKLLFAKRFFVVSTKLQKIGYVLSSANSKRESENHNNRPRSIDSIIWDHAKEHLSLIPSKKSHYSRNRSIKILSLNPNLYPKKLYDMFKIFCRDENIDMSKLLKYKTFH